MRTLALIVIHYLTQLFSGLKGRLYIQVEEQLLRVESARLLTNHSANVQWLDNKLLVNTLQS